MNSDTDNGNSPLESYSEKKTSLPSNKKSRKTNTQKYGENNNNNPNSDDDRDDKIAERKRIDAAMEMLEMAKAKARAQRAEYGEYLNWKVTMQRNERKQHEEEEKRLRARVGEKLKSVLAEHKAAKRAELTAYLPYAKGTAADVRESLFQHDSPTDPSTTQNNKSTLKLKENNTFRLQHKDRDELDEAQDDGDETLLLQQQNGSTKQRSRLQEPHQVKLNDSYAKEDEFYEAYLIEQDRKRDEWSRTKEVLGANYRRRATMASLTTNASNSAENNKSVANRDMKTIKRTGDKKGDPLENSQSMTLNISSANQKPQRPKVVAGVEIVYDKNVPSPNTAKKRGLNETQQNANGYVPVDNKNFSLQSARASAALATNLAITRRAQVLQMHKAKQQAQLLLKLNQSGNEGPTSIDDTAATSVPKQRIRKRRGNNNSEFEEEDYLDDSELGDDEGDEHDAQNGQSSTKPFEDEEGLAIKEYTKMMEPFLAAAKKENAKQLERQKMQQIRNEANGKEMVDVYSKNNHNATAGQSTISSRSKFAAESKSANAQKQQQILSDDEQDQLHRNQVRKMQIEKRILGEDDGKENGEDEDEDEGNYTSGTKPKLSRRERKLLSDITQKRFMLELRTTKVNDMMMKARTRRELASQRIAADPPADFLVGEHIQSYFSVDNFGLGKSGAIVTMGDNSDEGGHQSDTAEDKKSNWFLTQQQDKSLTETQIKGRKAQKKGGAIIISKSADPDTENEIATQPNQTESSSLQIKFPSIPVKSRLIQVHHLPRTTKTHWHPKYNPYGWMGVPLSANQNMLLAYNNNNNNDEQGNTNASQTGTTLNDEEEEDYDTERKRQQEKFLYGNSYKSNFESVVGMALDSTSPNKKTSHQNLPSPPKSAPPSLNTGTGDQKRNVRHASTLVVASHGRRQQALASGTSSPPSEPSLTIATSKFPVRNVKEEKAWLDWHEVHNRMLDGKKAQNQSKTTSGGNAETNNHSSIGNSVSNYRSEGEGLPPPSPLSNANERQVNGKTLIAQQQDRKKEDFSNSSGPTGSPLRTSINHRNLNISLLSASGVGGVPPPSTSPLLTDTNIERGVGAPKGYVSVSGDHPSSSVPTTSSATTGWKFNPKSFLPPVKSIKMDPDLETHGKFLKLDRERRNR